MTVDSPLVVEDIEAQLQHIVKRHGFQNPEIKFSTGSAIGDGFIGVTSAILLKDADKELGIFAKVAPKIESFRTSMNIREIFLTEIYFYENIYPTLSTFYADKVGTPLKFAPKSYQTSTEDMKEMILMENLRDGGFVQQGKGVTMNREQLSTIIKSYAKYHATSLALRDQKPEVFGALAKNSTNIFSEFFEKSGAEKMFVGGVQDAVSCFDENKDSEIIDKFKRASDKFVTFMKNGTTISEYCTFIHGDCWSGNMMFKYKDNALAEVRFIDFQGARLDIPVLDIAYFFYCNASKIDLDMHAYYFKLYYNTVSETIKNLGSDPKKMYPYNIFKEQLKEYCFFGLIFAVNLLKIVANASNPINIVESVKDGKSIGEAFQIVNTMSDDYKKRIKDIVLHFVENKYI